MSPESFVSQVRSNVIQENFAVYSSLFASTSVEAASDPYWKRALALHRSLSEGDRAVLLEIMRQVAVDTVSNLFGILDGVIAIDPPGESLVLTSEPDNRRLSGNLQELFLEAEEREQP